jgi:opacity protein-like surface antigen
MNKLLSIFTIFIVLEFVIFPKNTNAQVVNTATLDTNSVNIKGKLAVSGYVDAYYGYDFSNPVSSERLYGVSMNRHNEMTVNLAYADVRYISQRFRARFVPGFGTYVNANYTNEVGTMKNIIEGYVGMKLWSNKEIWLDMGVLGSPYTNESAISKDHLMYTRSFAPEYVPYYLSGLKLTLPINPKLNFYFYVLNGWQVIQDNNKGKSIGTQLEWRPNNEVLINWDTYIGDERSDQSPNFRTRYFSDLYVIYSPKGNFSATACAYIGLQDKLQANGTIRTDNWHTANAIGKYKINDKVNISGRIEYFSDANQTQIKPINNETSFNTYSASLGVNYNPMDNIFIRFESRSFYSDNKIYQNDIGEPSNYNSLAISSITIAF